MVEACWLLALVAVPIYFDTLTVRGFDPAKIVLFRNIVIIMVICALVRASIVAPMADVNEGLMSRWRQQVRRWPLVVPTAIFLLVYSVATFHSVLPYISFWGSYARMQGLYTWLSYGGFFLILSYFVRSWAQIERIISAVVFSTVPIAMYGVIQELQWDPIQSSANTGARVASTQGNPIFLGAYLLMCMPFVAYRLWRAIEGIHIPRTNLVSETTSPDAQPILAWAREATHHQKVSPVWPVIGYSVTLLLSFAALYFAGSRGPYYGFIAAIFIIGTALTFKWKNPMPAISGIVICIVLVGLPYALKEFTSQTAVATPVTGIASNTAHLTDFSDAGTEQVRFYIWQGSLPLIAQKPLLGWGPEDMLDVYAPYFPAGLGHLERANVAPDRNHDIWLDFLVSSGIIGLLAWIGLLATFFMMIVNVWRRALSRRATVLIAVILGVVVGHLVESSVGIEVVSTLMLLWTMFALATVLYAHPALAAASPTIDEVDLSSPSLPQPNSNQSSQSEAVATPSIHRQWQHVRQPVLIILTLSVGISGIVLFVYNVRIMQADYNYKQGQQYEEITSNCLKNLAPRSPSNPTGCLARLPAGTSANYVLQNIVPDDLNRASAFAQGAVSEQPSQDFYYQLVGRTDFDQAQYYLALVDAYKNQALHQTNKVQATDYLRQAETFSLKATAAFTSSRSAFYYSHLLDPYAADHTMNLARMLSFWAAYDPTKWESADYYYGLALSWARHNGRYADEWGRADMLEAHKPHISAAQRTLIHQQALAHFQYACSVDSLLGDARAFRGGAYQSLAQYKNAINSYIEALHVRHFETVATANVVQLLEGALPKVYGQKMVKKIEADLRHQHLIE